MVEAPLATDDESQAVTIDELVLVVSANLQISGLLQYNNPSLDTKACRSNFLFIWGVQTAKQLIRLKNSDYVMSSAIYSHGDIIKAPVQSWFVNFFLNVQPFLITLRQSGSGCGSVGSAVASDTREPAVDVAGKLPTTL